MFNMQGEVIGIASYIISSSGGFQGLGFVVTSNIARELLLTRPTPWSGLEGLLLTGELAGSASGLRASPHQSRHPGALPTGLAVQAGHCGHGLEE